MIPTFFPSTYVTPTTFDLCHEWFDQIIVYQASEAFIPDHYKNNQRLIIKTPLASQFDIQKFKQEIQYLNVLKRESGQNLDHLKARPEDIPFFDDTSVNRIRAQIKQKTHHHEQTDNKQLLFALYCQLFQDLDMQQEDVNHTFNEIEQSHTKLFQQLNNDFSSCTSQSNDNSKKVITHITERLKIFFNLYQYDQEKSTVLLTDHEDFILEIQEWNNDLELIYRIDQAQMDNAKQLLQDYMNIKIHQLSLPVKTKKLSLYHSKKQLLGSFMPSDITPCENIRIIVLE